MSKMEIKTRIMGQPNGSGELKLTVKNGWKFWNIFAVENSNEVRVYLKSDEFKEFAYSVFSKYEGMSYDEMCNTDRKSDFQKIWDKLDRFAWKPDEAPFKINVSYKVIRTYCDGFTYRIVFSNNKDKRRCWYRKSLITGYAPFVDDAYQHLDDIYWYLYKDKAFNDKLATYKNWDEFFNNMSSDGFEDIMNSCIRQAKNVA